MNTHVIIGTAGHIDHGKTALIKALSGINTDRLKEEQKRGITIELGFAHLDLPGGATVGIVDVPGHEKFVRHMVAGAAGIDLVMLIIAADEGIMPQTREHMDICRMLGIERGLVAVTKSDLCEPEWVEMVTEEIREFTRGTFLENSPVIPLSSVTGEGISDLLTVLEDMVKEVQPRPTWGIFRMPADRVFTMKGFGTVVTGCALSGKIAVGDPVTVYPGGIESRVRGLQVHNKTVTVAEAGCRTAINLQGVQKDQVSRGDVIGLPGQLSATYILDVRISLLPSAPKALTNRTRIRFHIGTAEILGRIYLLETDELKPASQSLAQIRLEKPAVAMARDRFVIRSYSPATTVGGGSVIDPGASKYDSKKRNQPSVIKKLKALEKGSPSVAIMAALVNSGPAGQSVISLARSLNLDETSVVECLAELAGSGAVHRLGQGRQDPVLHTGVLQELVDSAMSILDKFHAANPLKSGISKEEMKTRLPKNLHPKFLAFLLEKMESENAIIIDGKIVRSAKYRIKLDLRQEELKSRIEDLIRKSDLSVPSPEEVSKQLRASGRDVAGLIGLLSDEGTLIKVHEDIYIHHQNFENVVSRVRTHFKDNADLTVSDFKEMTGLTRKYSIPLLEFFDRRGITLRVGDKRVAKCND